MKRLHILVGMLLTILSINAQQLTLEYNFGYGTYAMDKLKSFMKYNLPTPVKNIRITDNFPGYLTHEGKVGIAWNPVHQTGILLGYMNTAGSSGVADYSGSYRVDLRIKGIRTGLFYRFAFPAGAQHRISPYLQLSTGAVFNRLEMKEAISLGANSQSESSKLKGTNFYVEPSVGLYFKVLPKISLTVSGGYQWDFRKQLTIEGSAAKVNADWSGLRLQGGVIYYIPF